MSKEIDLARILALVPRANLRVVDFVALLLILFGALEEFDLIEDNLLQDCRQIPVLETKLTPSNDK